VNLGVDPDDLATCVQCGLCLTSCPTYRVTGNEAWSPRGRIHLMRDVERGALEVTDDVTRAFETCIQCLGCETACPSGVPYGRLIERTRTTLAARGTITPRWYRWALAAVWHPRLLHAGSAVLSAAGRRGLPVRRIGIPLDVPIRRRPHRTSGGDVYLFTGCVMDSWQRHVHEASQLALEAVGFGVTPTGAGAPCCGALHAHAGLPRGIERAVSTLLRALDASTPIVVDAAGCGAAMKGYGTHLGSPEAAALSARVVDVCELLATRLDRLPERPRLDVRVAIQDPCHLRHVQRVHAATREVLARVVREVVELDDDGICCGAGGGYSVLEPALAAEVRARKLAAVDRARPDVVASANPGCALHLGVGPHRVVHPVELVAAALRETPLDLADRRPPATS